MNRRRVIWIVLGLTILVGVGAAATFLDPSGRVRGWATGEPFYQGRSASAWHHDLRQSDEVAATAAREALAKGKADAVPVCSWLLAHAQEPEVRTHAVTALKQMGKEVPPAGPALMVALGDSDPIVRGAATRAVGDLAPDVPDAVRPLIRLFPDVEAIRAVAKFRTAGADAVPQLIGLLRHDDPIVRRASCKTLGKIGAPALSALPDLIRSMGEDSNEGVREQAAEAIGEIGPAAKEAIPALMKALKDPVWNVRKDAVRSLGQIGPAAKASLPDVLSLTADPEDRVRVEAEKAARLIDPSLVGKK